MDAFSLAAQYGLPLVMFFGVIWLSYTEIIIWRPTYRAILTAKDDRIKDLEEQIRELTKDKRDFHEGWIKSLSAGKSVAQAAARAMDIADIERDR